MQTAGIKRRVAMLRLREELYATTWANRLHRHFDKAVTADSQQGNIGSPSFCSRLGRCDYVSASIQWMLQSEFRGNSVSFRIEITGKHSRTGSLGKGRKQNAYRALPDY